MHQINDAIVQGGRVTIEDLPFRDGQHVRVVIMEEDVSSTAGQRRPIAEVRRLLKGGVERFDDALDPMIPIESWEMLK